MWALPTHSRKKARCPGEKPVCSLCQRLGQRCEYGAQAAISRTRVRKESSSAGLDIDADEPQEVPTFKFS
ncbi:unnamed protein product [Penicillium manginii]